jgi:hypothetical protein
MSVLAPYLHRAGACEVRGLVEPRGHRKQSAGLFGERPR